MGCLEGNVGYQGDVCCHKGIVGPPVKASHPVHSVNMFLKIVATAWLTTCHGFLNLRQ